VLLWIQDKEWLEETGLDDTEEVGTTAQKRIELNILGTIKGCEKF
jgi:hypothetical protein